MNETELQDIINTCASNVYPVTITSAVQTTPTRGKDVIKEVKIHFIVLLTVEYYKELFVVIIILTGHLYSLFYLLDRKLSASTI